jgi:uncharacterized repeat protein (TIGR01451 family)
LSQVFFRRRAEAMRCFRNVFAAVIVAAMSFSLAMAGEDDGDAPQKNIKFHDGKVYVWKGFPGPCPAPSQSIVLLEKESAAEVIVGEVYEYVITVSNRTAFSLKKVVLTDKLPKDFKLESAEPAVKPGADGFVSWDLGTLGPKQKTVIKIRGSATAVGTLIHAGLAEITFELPLAIPVRVVEPKLELVKVMPTEAILGEAIPIKLVVSNPGTATATNVVVSDILPEGITTTGGKTSFEVKIDKLRPGESREFVGALLASKVGVLLNTATATADRGLKVTANAKTVVRQPMLTVVKTGPKQAYIEQPIPYEIVVTNTGDAPAEKTVVIDDSLPEYVRVLEIGEKGVLVHKDPQVAWELGTLAPKESRTLHLVLRADRICTVVNTATATARGCEPKSATVKTEVVGIPGVLTEVRDTYDPVPVGGVATYVVREIGRAHV